MRVERRPKGIFFDLYGTLIIYGDRTLGWSSFLTDFQSRLIPLGLSIPSETFSRECSQFFDKEEPPRANDGFTVFERRISCLCQRLGLTAGVNEIASIADDVCGKSQQRLRVDEDAAAVLGALRRDKSLALVSNYDHPRHVRTVLSTYQLTGYFQSIVISGEVGVSKPDPRIFDPALAQTGLSPSEVVYVGDTEDDVTAARGAGIFPVLIQRPSHAPDPNSLAFRSDEDVRASEHGLLRGPTVTKVSSLKDLLSLFP